jgi:hypothetical protein
LNRAIRICRKCATLYDDGDDSGQRCACDRKDQSSWSGYDYNEHTCLCHCCMRQTLRSGSRWSVWFCQGCKQRVLTLNRRVGLAVIPIGRHSLMNGIGLSGEAATKRSEVDAFTARLNAFFERVNDLYEWTRVKLHTNLLRVDMLWAGDPRLDEYLGAVRAGSHPQLTEEQSFIDLCAFMDVPEALIEG